jgi:hypothetical protein
MDTVSGYTSTFTFQGNPADLFDIPLPPVTIPPWPETKASPPPEIHLFHDDDDDAMDITSPPLPPIVNDEKGEKEEEEDEESSSVGPIDGEIPLEAEKRLDGDGEKEEEDAVSPSSGQEEQQQQGGDDDDGDEDEEDDEEEDPSILREEELHTIRLARAENKQERALLGEEEDEEEEEEDEDDEDVDMDDDEDEEEEEEEEDEEEEEEENEDDHSKKEKIAEEPTSGGDFGSVDVDDDDDEDEEEEEEEEEGGNMKNAAALLSFGNRNHMREAIARHLLHVIPLSVGHRLIAPPAAKKKKSVPHATIVMSEEEDKNNNHQDADNDDPMNVDTEPRQTIQEIIARYNPNFKLPEHVTDDKIIRSMSTIAQAQLLAISGDAGAIKRLSDVRDHYTVVANATPAVKEQNNHLALACCDLWELSQAPDVNYKLFPK